MTSVDERIQALQKENKRLSALNDATLRASGRSLLVVNKNGIIRSLGNGTSKIFGYDANDKLLHRSVNDFLQGLDLLNYRQREVSGVHADGSVLNLDVRMADVRVESDGNDDDDEIVIMIKKVGDSLTSKIIDAAFNALFVINQRGIIQMVNEQSTRAFGWSREEFLGQNVSMIMPEGHASNHDGYLANYVATGVKRMIGTEREVEARCKDGSSFPCILSLNEVDDIRGGGGRLFCGFIRSLAREKSLELRVSAAKKTNVKNTMQILAHKAAIKQQKETLHRTRAELQALQDTIHSSIGTTKHGDAVEFVDSLINQESHQDEREKLKLIRDCLIRGNDDSMHIPQNLDKDEAYIMKEFAGMTNLSSKRNFGSRRISLSGPSTWNFAMIIKAGETPSLTDAASIHCLPEFTKQSLASRKKLFELLSFDNLKRWDFNIFDVAEIDQQNTLLLVSWATLFSPYSQIAMAKELRQAGVEAIQGRDDFRGYDFTDLDFTIDNEKLINYLRLMQEGYKDNPYHNRIHAADVVQTLHSLLHMAGDEFSFDKEDLFLVLISAVVHDVKHPGRNNAFQVNSFSELALERNDISVLESEHVSYAFKCMIKDEDSRFINADPLKLHEVRKKIIEAVLHTDMSKHFSSVSKIKTAAGGKSWDELEANVQWEVLNYFLHMADISNPAKGDPMFKLWTDRCLDEFFQQGDIEREMGVPISPNCDRTTTKKPDSQIGFIRFVVKPAYEVLGDIVPAVKDNILPIIENNLAYWGGQ